MAFVELFGETLLARVGTGPEEFEKKSTAEVLAGKKAVAIYFSGHWCPPCRGFTPQLAEWYNADLKAKGLEVVFVSSDREEKGFKEYFGEMPWLSLPFEDKDRKAKLSKKFKCEGIPHLVILDGEGKMVTLDGRSAVSKDPKGEKMPWIPTPPKELLAKMKLKKGKDDVSLQDAIKDKKALGLYFSAHWCPPCRGFTPKLAEWYTKDLSAKGLEVIFLSSDRDESAFSEYYAEMPWLALDYSQRDLKGELSDTFGVNGIPSFIILDADLNVITTEGRGAVSSDPDGNDLPWHPKPVTNLKGGPGKINDTPTVVGFCETSTPEEQKAIEAVLWPFGEECLKKAKETEEDPEFAFTLATGNDGLVSQLRGMCGMPKLPPAKHEHPLEKSDRATGWGCDGCGCSGEGKERWRCTQGCDFDFCGDCHEKMNLPVEPQKPRIAIIDCPRGGKYYLAPEGNIGEPEVKQMLADYKEDKLEFKDFNR